MSVLTFRTPPSLIQLPVGQMSIQNPQSVLVFAGPRVPVTISLTSVIAAQYSQDGLIAPAALTGYALIDSGAANTCVDEAAVIAGGYNPIDKSFMTSATHEKIPCGIFAINININSVSIDVNRASGANLAPQNLLALIGRDVLSNAIFVYNGVSGEFVLSF